MADNNITWGTSKNELNTNDNDIKEYIDAINNSNDSYGYITENDYMTLNSDTLSTNFKITCNSPIDSNIRFCSDSIPYSYDVKVSLIGSSDYNENDTPYYQQIIWNSYNTDDQDDSTHYTKNPDSLYKWAYKELTPFEINGKGSIYYKGKSTDTGGTNRKYLQFAFRNSDNLLNYTRGIDIYGDPAYPSVFISSSSTEATTRNLLVSNVDISNFKQYINLLSDENTYTLKPMYFKKSTNYSNLDGEFDTYYDGILSNFKTDTSTDYIACLNKSSSYKNLEAITNTTYYLTQSNIYIKKILEYTPVYTQAAFMSGEKTFDSEDLNFINIENKKGSITLNDITSGLKGDGNSSTTICSNMYCPIVLVLFFETSVTITKQPEMNPQYKCVTIPIPKDKLGEEINFTSDDCIYSLLGTKDTTDDVEITSDLNNCLFYEEVSYVYLHTLELKDYNKQLKLVIRLKNIMSSVSDFKSKLKGAYVYCFRG